MADIHFYLRVEHRHALKVLVESEMLATWAGFMGYQLQRYTCICQVWQLLLQISLHISQANGQWQ